MSSILRFAVALTIAAALSTPIAKAQGGDWVWVGGSKVANSQPGIYGTQGVAAPGNQPAGREYGASATDANGNLWLFGGSAAASVTDGSIHFNDLWEFNPTTKEWTSWSGRDTTTPGIYGTLGVAALGNVPGAREEAVLWADHSGNVWLFGGWGYDSAGTFGVLNDLWKFDVAKSRWTWISGSSTLPNASDPCQHGVYERLGFASPEGVPGGRQGATGWTDNSGNLWLFGGGGCGADDAQGLLDDMWEYDLATGQWTWFSGLNTHAGGGGYGVVGTPSADNLPGGRWFPVNLGTDTSGNFWLFGGDGFDITATRGLQNDLWEFDPATKEWTWQGGSARVPPPSPYLNGPPGVHGTLGQYAPGNAPSGRNGGVGYADGKGKLWLFGGTNNDISGFENILNDLWAFDPVSKQWAWMSGSETLVCLEKFSNGACALHGGAASYGPRGVASAPNVPGGRQGEVGWTDTNGNLWVFGGDGVDFGGNVLPLNDLWQYQPNDSQTPTVIVATPVFSPGAGTYASAQTVAITDATPGATIYYTADGTTPTTNSAVYTGPITVSSTETLMAIAAVSAPGGQVIFSENFDELNARASATSAGKFTAINGTDVDIVGPGYYANLCTTPELDNCIDMAGSSSIASGQLQSNPIELTPGTYALSFDLVGSHRGASTNTSVTLGPATGAALYSNTFALASEDTTSGIVANSLFTVATAETVYLNFELLSTQSTFLGSLLDKISIQGVAYAPSAVATAAYVISEPTTIVFAVPGHTYGDAPFTVGATSNSTGDFMYSAVSGPASVLGTVVTLTGAGTVTLKADQAADSGHALGSQTATFAVAKATPLFGTMTFSPSASVIFGTSQAVTVSDTLSYSGTQPPTGAVTYSLNGVGYTAVCTAGGSPETCSATIPAATIAALAVGPFPVTGSLTGDKNYAAETTSGTFTASAGGACTIPAATSGTMKIDYFTLANTDKDASSFPNGVSSDYVLPALGANGFPVYNVNATVTTGAIAAPKDLLADGEITWWSAALNNGGAAGGSDVVATETGVVVPLPFSNDLFFPPNGTGPNDFSAFQTAMLTGTLVAPSAETVSFSIASDDMAFLYLDGQVVCDDGGVHGSTSVPCTSSTITAGTHTLRLFYADLNSYGAALDFSLTTSNVAVGAGDQLVFGTMTFSPTATVMRGTSETISVADTLFYSGPAPTGAVAFVLNDVSYPATCSASGSPATCTADVPAAMIAALPAAIYTATGSFAGDCNYARAVAPSGTFTVTRNPVVFGTMTFSPAATVVYGTSEVVTISDTLSYPDTQPAGAVAYVLKGVSYTATCTTAGSPETCTAAVPAAAVAKLPVADYTVAGSFAGDANYLPATATSGTFAVTIASTATTLTTSATTLVFGQPLTLKGTVTSPTGSIPAGTIMFLNGAASLGSAALNGAGVATLTLTPAVGIYSITAAYGGSQNDLPSASSPAITVTVTPAPTTATLTSNLNPAEGGSSVTFTISVQSGAGPASGSVILTDGSTVLAPLALNASGAATYTTSTLAIGAHPLIASYTGNASFNASQGSLTQVILPPPDFSIKTNGPLALVTQHHGPTTVTVTPIYGFSGLVTLSCGNLPAYVTCQWGEARRAKGSLAVAGVAASTELKIDTSAVIDYLASSETAERNGTGFAVAGAMFVPLFFLLRKRRSSVRLLLCIFAVLAAMHMSGCSSRYPASTPPGTYSITLQGVSGELKRTAVLTLVVTP